MFNIIVPIDSAASIPCPPWLISMLQILILYGFLWASLQNIGNLGPTINASQI